MSLECRHIKPSGAKCRANALRDMPYCYFHTRQHRHAAKRALPVEKDEPLEIPILEDRSAVQIAVSQVLCAIASARIDPRRAGLMLYGLQIASQNAKESLAIVRMDAVENMTCTADGEELGPEEWDCIPDADCSECEIWENCKNPQRAVEEDDGEIVDDNASEGKPHD